MSHTATFDDTLFNLIKFIKSDAVYVKSLMCLIHGSYVCIYAENKHFSGIYYSFLQFFKKRFGVDNEIIYCLY